MYEASGDYVETTARVAHGLPLQVVDRLVGLSILGLRLYVGCASARIFGCPCKHKLVGVLVIILAP